MHSPKTPKSPNPSDDLASQLNHLGLLLTAQSLDDLLARAETKDLARRSLERRRAQARLGRFKPLADFDWHWPKKIDRPLIERAFTLEFLAEARNLILIGAHGLGKTMITKNIAPTAILAGHSVLCRTVSDLLADLDGDSPGLRRPKFRFYARPALLCLDEVGYLTYDPPAADLLYEVINRRYERNSLILTTNRAFKDWNTVFPNATCIATLLDPLMPLQPDLDLGLGVGAIVVDDQVQGDVSRKVVV